MMNQKRIPCVLALALVLSSPLVAQTAAVLDSILATSAVTVAQGAYLVLGAVGTLPEDATLDQAFTLLAAQGWMDFPGGPHRALRCSEFALMVTRAWRLPSGILASLFPGPRYTFRDRVFDGLFSDTDPEATLAGAEAVRILGRLPSPPSREPS